MLEFKYDTQLLIEGENLDEDAISDYFQEHFRGDCLLAVGDEELIKIHFHTNEPWKVLEYCAGLGEIYDIVVEDMDRQSRGCRGREEKKGLARWNLQHARPFFRVRLAVQCIIKTGTVKRRRVFQLTVASAQTAPDPGTQSAGPCICQSIPGRPAGHPRRSPSSGSGRSGPPGRCRTPGRRSRSG